jgi:predicted RNase H-like nuclease (RuvC/YqgF family)
LKDTSTRQVRKLMRLRFFRMFAIAVLLASTAYGQALGDVARENREKKAADASTADAAAGNTVADQRAARRAAEQRLAEQRAAGQWKRQILAQENKVATLQARIDQLNALIRSAYGTVQYEPPYNRYQARQLQRVAQMQEQLDEQKIKLEQMQEAARHADMHTAIYDP